MTINKRYMLLQGGFWMLFCVVTGFVSLYLQGRGLGTGAIGTVTAVFGILASLLQPLLGRVCDNHPSMTWRRMLLSLCLPFPFICVLMLLVPGALSGGVFMGLLMLLVSTTMPFINSANFYYQRQGEYINFGVARGMGSCLFALLALVLGRLAQRFGINAVPVSGIAVSLVFLLVASRMPCRAESAPEQNISGLHSVGLAEILRRYPAFSLMLTASLLMLTSHNITCTYLLQIIQSLGGNSSDFGVALAIQAIVEVPVLFGFSMLLKRFKPAQLMFAATVGFFLKAGMYAISGSVPMIFVTQLTQIVSFALFASASVYYAYESILPEDRTTGQALMTSMLAAGAVLGNLMGGWLMELSGISLMLGVNLAVALAGVVCGALSCRMKNRLD